VVSEICVASSNILASFTAIRDVSTALSRIYSVDILIVSVLASVVPFHILMAAIVLSEILLTVLAYVYVMRLGEFQKKLSKKELHALWIELVISLCDSM
jgi:hypothetical protein